jgi:rhamnose transport system substrate-binding protein
MQRTKENRITTVWVFLAALLLIPASSFAQSDLIIKAVQNTKKNPSEITIAHSTFVRGVGYFTGIEQGMLAAGKHYGCKIVLGGPTQIDMAAQQAEMATWVDMGYDAICFIAGDPASLTPTINKGVAKGIVMISYDSDAPKSDRQVFNNQANDIDQAKAQLDELARQMHGEGKWAFLVGNFTQELKMFQYDYMKKYAAEKYPKMTFTEILECKGDQALINEQVRDLLTKYPDLRGIVSNDGSGPSSIAQTLKDLGKSGQVAVTGLTVPSVAYNLVKSGALPAFYIWNVFDLGYRNVAIAWELLHGHDITKLTKLPLNDKESPFADIRKNLLNPLKLDIVLGNPLRIDPSDVDKYNFF